MGVPRKTGKLFKKDNKIILQSFDKRVENEKQSRYDQEEEKRREQEKIVARNLKKKEIEKAQKILVSKQLKRGLKSIIGVKRVQPAFGKQMDKKLESVNEGRYHEWRNDDSMTPKQKIGRAMREVRKSLGDLNKMVEMCVRLKNETKVDTRTYWKSTNRALTKISERLVKIANKVGKLQ